jgi:FkbM family methyltransferase
VNEEQTQTDEVTAGSTSGARGGLPRLLVVTRYGLGVNDASWLEHRLRLISAITGPSLAAQSERRFTWAVFVDPTLPDRLRRALEELLEPLDHAVLVESSEHPYTTEGFLRLARELGTVSGEEWLFTARLDDDDAWHRDVVRRVYAAAQGWLDARGPERAAGLGISFDRVLIWIMYDVLCVGPLAAGKTKYERAGMRESIHSFESMSVFVLSRMSDRISARSAGHYDMPGFLRERGFDVEVHGSREPMTLYCRHKQVNTAIRRGRKDAEPRSFDIEELSRMFGIDVARTRRYIAEEASFSPLLVEKPNQSRRQRLKTTREINQRLLTAEAEEAAELRAERRLLEAEGRRASEGPRVAEFPELLRARGDSDISEAERHAELRGVLAERARARAEVKALLVENERVALAHETKLDAAQAKLDAAQAKLDAAQAKLHAAQAKAKRLAKRASIWNAIKTHLPELSVDRVLDVGANVGKTVAAFQRRFPGAEIWAFEPVKASYEQLVQSTASVEGIQCFNFALGAQSAAGHITAAGTSEKNRLVPARSGRATQSVPIVAGTDFCDEHGIDRISYLKVDTEGHDLEVLRGFEPMLRDSRVDVVEVEAGMNPENELHVPLQDFLAFLQPCGYRLFRTFGEVSEKPVKGPYLRRVNAVFISPSVIGRHRPPAASRKTKNAVTTLGSPKAEAPGGGRSALAAVRAALHRRLPS